MIGESCPVCEDNSEHWNAGDKRTARTRARQQGGISNILIINDPQSPECNGKVFLYNFKKRILEKIKKAKNPDENMVRMGVKPINVFDYYEGANFRLVAATTETVDESTGKTNKFPDYSQSTFESPSKLGDDDYLEQIEKQLMSITEFIDPSGFKNYDALKEQFVKIWFSKNQQQPSSQFSQTLIPPQQMPVQQAPQQMPVQQAPQQMPVQQAPQQMPVQQAPQQQVNTIDSNDLSEDEFFNMIKKKKK